MTLKNAIQTLVVTATLAASGSASAQVFPWSWDGTLQNFVTLGSILDSNPPVPALGTSSAPGTGDGDATFTYVTSTNFNLANTSVTITDQHLSSGVDLYNVGVGFIGGQNFGTLGYLVSTNVASGLNMASLSSLVTVGGVGVNGSEVIEQIYASQGGALLLTLDSKNSAVVPVTGLNPFAGHQSVYVLDTKVNTGGLVQDFHNNLSAVPVPGAVWLFGSALAGFTGLNLRKRNKLVA